MKMKQVLEDSKSQNSH